MKYQPMESIEARIKQHARTLGFDAVGFTPARPGTHLPFYLDWISNHYHGEQRYLARPDRLERRLDLQKILPDARSLVIVGRHYWPGLPPQEFDDPSRGWISCYATDTDYHDSMLPPLEQLLEFIQEIAQIPIQGRCYVDTGPLMERDHAVSAGLGFIGKNCQLLQPRYGSWLFLGVIIIDYALQCDRAGFMPNCGTCNRCQDACPTCAFVEPYKLDSRRCISYLTTYLKGPIPIDLRNLMGNRIFGCDICQIVCPWNRFASSVQPINPEYQRGALSLIELLALSQDEFINRFGKTPIGHIGRERFLRNVAVAIGNWGHPDAIPILEQTLQDPSPLIRAHVAWALGQIRDPAAQRILHHVLQTENDPVVLEEINNVLGADKPM